MARDDLDDVWGLHDLILDIRDEWPPLWDEAPLLAWLEQHPGVAEFLHDVGQPQASRPLPAGDERLWALYVINRLTEILIAPLQPVNVDPALLSWTNGQPWWPGPPAAETVWPALWTALGASTIAEDAFHPFFHEIVGVEPADDPDQPPALVAEHWPGALVGSMLLIRSGVTVRAGANHLDPHIASRSCLYWAWYRRNRLVRDLSHGWGSNSQWRTDFRRDYRTDAGLHYHVDAINAGRTLADDADLTERERIDLVRYRHSLRRDLGDDRWPYHDGFTEPHQP